MLFCITGANGAGKSACLPLLRTLFPVIPWYDLHDHGEYPSDAIYDFSPSSSISWRQAITEYWLQRAIEHQKQEQDMGLCGAVFGELLACPSATGANGIAAIMLDCTDVVRINRLRARGDQTSYATQDVLSWSAWQRMHAVDPQWRQDVLRAEGISAFQWQRWENWQQGDTRWQMQLIDTTSLTINGMVERVAGWLLMQKHLQTQNQLSLQGNWWKK